MFTTWATVLIPSHQQPTANRLSFMSSANVISGLHPDLSVESQCWAGLQGLPLDWPSHLQSPTRLIPNLPTEMSLMWLPPGSSNKCIRRSCLPGSQCSLTDPAIFCPGSWAICLTIFSRVTGHLLNNPFQCRVWGHGPAFDRIGFDVLTPQMGETIPPESPGLGVSLFSNLPFKSARRECLELRNWCSF